MEDKPKGMRHLTRGAGAGCGQAGNETQTVAQLVYLYHDKARLERTLQIWQRNKNRTERALEKTQQQIDELKKLLEDEEQKQSGRTAGDTNRCSKNQPIELSY